MGEEPVKEISEFELSTGTLRVLSSTDCVKDRLCAFYFWNDLQGLEQAVLVAKSQQVDLKEIKRWSKVEEKKKNSKHLQTNLLFESHNYLNPTGNRTNLKTHYRFHRQYCNARRAC